jgi:phosphoglycolate phosphatase
MTGKLQGFPVYVFCEAMVDLLCQQQRIAAVEAIIFDKDGTLADSRAFIQRLAIARAEACTRLALGHRSPGMVDALLGAVGISSGVMDADGLMATGTRQANGAAMAAVLRELGYAQEQVTAWVHQALELADQVCAQKTHHTPPYGGTERLLQRLHLAPVKVGVLSSDSSVYVQDFLAHYGLRRWVDDCQGTDPGDPAKPDPALLYGLCDRLGVNPHHTVIVGDSWADLQLAERARAVFISVSEAWGRSPVPGSSLVLGSWDDLQVAASP